MLRFPKGDVGRIFRPWKRIDGIDVLVRPAAELGTDVLLVAVGSFAPMAIKVAERLRKQGIG